MTFFDREAIGLVPPNLAHMTTRTLQQTTGEHVGFTGHWVGAPPAQRYNTAQQMERLRRIQAMEMSRNPPYGDISYNGGFDADGHTYGLRDPKFVGAHALSDGNVANIHTDGIVFLNDNRGMTPAAAAAFDWWRNLYRYVHHREPYLFTHNWWQHLGGITTACAGPEFDQLIVRLGGRA